MTATITRIPVSAPQATPDEAAQTATFTKSMADAFIAEGYRRACEEFGIPYFPQASAPVRRLSVLGPVS